MEPRDPDGAIIYTVAKSMACSALYKQTANWRLMPTLPCSCPVHRVADGGSRQ